MTSAEKAKPKPRERQKGARAPARQGQATAPPEPSEPPDDTAWRERAAFQVAFDQMADAAGRITWRTRAYHEEADGRAEWPGVADAALLDWMRARAGLPGLTTGAEPSANLQLDLGSLEVAEIPTEQQLGGQARPKRLRAQVALQLSGPQAYLITASQARCAVQILAYDLSSGGTAMLVEQPLALRPELLDYSATADFDLPHIGRYQLIGMALLPDHDAAGVTLGPLLTVTP